VTVVNGMGGAQFAGELKPHGIDINPDDRVAPDEMGRHDCRKADCPRAEDGDAGTRRDLEGVRHGACARLYPTTQWCKNLQRHFLGHLNGVASRRQSVSREGRLPKKMPSHATSLQGVAAIESAEPEVCFVETFALRRVFLATRTTAATGLV